MTTMTTERDVPNKSTVEAALYTFANASEMEQKSESLRKLMKGGAIHSVRDDPRFIEGVNEAVKEIHSTGYSKEKLFALALIARISSRINAKRAELDQAVRSALQVSLPKFSLLSDAEDRSYVAQALRHGSGDWIIPYIAQSIVEEEAGEKARSELIRILLEKTSHIAGAFNALGKALIEWKPQTEEPGNTAGRRLKRVLAAIRPEILLTENPPGDVVGESVDQIVYRAFGNTGLPTSPDVSANVAIEVVALLHDLVRTRFSLATDGTTYKVIGRLSRWYTGGGGWPKTMHSPLSRLSHDIEEAITLLAKQGVCDDNLLRALTTVEGSRNSALRVTRRVARNAKGLRAEIIEWLRRGRVTSQGRGAERLAESNWLSNDVALAQLLVDSGRLHRLLEDRGEDLLNDLRIFSPNNEYHTLTIFRRTKALVEGIRMLARSRNLRVRGRPGEVVDYSPIEHEAAGMVVVGARRVRLVSPLVERVRADGVEDVVVQALVEPA